MSEQNTNTWPFSEIPDADDLDISAIFGGNGTATNDNGKNPFEAPAPPVPVDAAPVTPQTPPAATVPPLPRRLPQEQQRPLPLLPRLNRQQQPQRPPLSRRMPQWTTPSPPPLRKRR